MFVKFFWVDRFCDGRIYPYGNILDKQSMTIKCPLFTLLSDDEGNGIEYLQEWAKQLLFYSEKIKNEELDFYDAFSFAWGVEITKDNILIYWGYDDTECESSMRFIDFYIILEKWYQFITQPPSMNTVLEFEVSQI